MSDLRAGNRHDRTSAVRADRHHQLVLDAHEDGHRPRLGQLLEVMSPDWFRQADGHRVERRPGPTALRLVQQRPHAGTVPHHEDGNGPTRGRDGRDRAGQDGHRRHRRGQGQSSRWPARREVPLAAPGASATTTQRATANETEALSSARLRAVRVGSHAAVPAGERHGQRPGGDQQMRSSPAPSTPRPAARDRLRPPPTGRRGPRPGPWSGWRGPVRVRLSFGSATGTAAATGTGPVVSVICPSPLGSPLNVERGPRRFITHIGHVPRHLPDGGSSGRPQPYRMSCGGFQPTRWASPTAASCEVTSSLARIDFTWVRTVASATTHSVAISRTVWPFIR